MFKIENVSLILCEFNVLFTLSIWALISHHSFLFVCLWAFTKCNSSDPFLFRIFSIPDTKQSLLFLLCSSSHAGHVFSSFFYLGDLLSHSWTFYYTKPIHRFLSPLHSLPLHSSRKGHTAASFFLFFRQSTVSNAFFLLSIVVMIAIIIIKPVSPLPRTDFSYTISW